MSGSFQKVRRLGEMSLPDWPPALLVLAQVLRYLVRCSQLRGLLRLQLPLDGEIA